MTRKLRLLERTVEVSDVVDINGLIGRAVETFNGLDNLPFQEIIKQIAAYKGRSRRARS